MNPDISVDIHRKNLRKLMLEDFKSLNYLSPEFCVRFIPHERNAVQFSCCEIIKPCFLRHKQGILMNVKYAGD